ncbi:MAG: hypothetical protein ACI4J8_00115 [Oscillospiraceae bacterium]
MKRNRYYKSLLAAFSVGVCSMNFYSRLPPDIAPPPVSMSAFVAARQRRRKKKHR